nr:MAG TPA: hypothetical protein [Caudoviricetes sp.]
MGRSEFRGREAGAAVGGQPTNSNPAKATRCSDGHGGFGWRRQKRRQSRADNIGPSPEPAGRRPDQHLIGRIALSYRIGDCPQPPQPFGFARPLLGGGDQEEGEGAGYAIAIDVRNLDTDAGLGDGDDVRPPGRLGSDGIPFQVFKKILSETGQLGNGAAGAIDARRVGDPHQRASRSKRKPRVVDSVGGMAKLKQSTLRHAEASSHATSETSMLIGPCSSQRLDRPERSVMKQIPDQSTISTTTASEPYTSKPLAVIEKSTTAAVLIGWRTLVETRRPSL